MQIVQFGGIALRALGRGRFGATHSYWAGLSVLLYVMAGTLARAEFPLRPIDPLRATSSAEARQSAIEAIPLGHLSPDGQAKVQQVLARITVFRRMPVQVIDCDPDMYLFLARHPDVVVCVWETLGLTQLQVRQQGPNSFSLIDNVGTQGKFEYLYTSHDTHVVYASGLYQGPLMAKPVRGQCLLVLKSGYVRETNGRYYITNRLDTFVSVEPGGAELLTKTLQPLVTKVADSNFTQTVAFVGSLSRTAEVNQRGVQRLASRLHDVQPEVRGEFARVALGVAEKSPQQVMEDQAAAEVAAEQPETLLK